MDTAAQSHQPEGVLPIQNGGLPAVLYCFAFLVIATRGSRFRNSPDESPPA